MLARSKPAFARRRVRDNACGERPLYIPVFPKSSRPSTG
jgi:hypothetical protein